MKYLPTILLIAACGGGGGGGATVDGPNQIDAKVFHDAPPNVPEMITISGTANETDANSATPTAGIVLSFFRATDETTPIGTATSGADGKFSFTIATNGEVVDGFVKATISGYVDNYIYATAPLLADYSTDANMVTTGNYAGLTGFTGQMPSLGFVAAVVVDGTGAAVAGAAVTSTPSSVQYMYSSDIGIPTNASGTNTDGQAYFVNLPAGNAEVTATKAGITFHAHTVKGHPGALTTTLIAP